MSKGAKGALYSDNSSTSIVGFYYKFWPAGLCIIICYNSFDLFHGLINFGRFPKCLHNFSGILKPSNLQDRLVELSDTKSLEGQIVTPTPWEKKSECTLASQRRLSTANCIPTAIRTPGIDAA
jgi:hypothetical protein